MSPNNDVILLFASAVLIFKLKVQGIIFSQLGSIQARLYEKGQKQAYISRRINNFQNAVLLKIDL